jgi:hypothetical protein
MVGKAQVTRPRGRDKRRLYDKLLSKYILQKLVVKVSIDESG